MGTYKDLFEQEDVQYGDFRGTVAADITDFHSLAEFLGLAPMSDLILRVDISSYGGHQVATALVADLNQVSMQDVINRANRKEKIPVREVRVIDWGPNGHADTNPPKLGSFPARSVTELLEHAFKRLHITLIPSSTHFPIDTVLEILEI